jgi:hypothetical protein
MDNRKLPLIVAAFGLLIIFSQIHFRNGMIYRIASAAFDVYLVSDPLLSVSCCSKKVYSEQGYNQPCALPCWRAGHRALPVFSACTILDLLCQLLFRVAVGLPWSLV